MKNIENMTPQELLKEGMGMIKIFADNRESQTRIEIQLAQLTRLVVDMQKKNSCNHQINNNLLCKK